MFKHFEFFDVETGQANYLCGQSFEDPSTWFISKLMYNEDAANILLRIPTSVGVEDILPNIVFPNNFGCQRLNVFTLNPESEIWTQRVLVVSKFWLNYSRVQEKYLAEHIN